MSTKALVLALLSATPCVGSAEAGEPSPPAETGAVVPGDHVTAVGKSLATHLRLDDSVGDILRHPAFAGFGRLLLPWDDRHYDDAVPLSGIGSLLPYHQHVDPSVVVSALNRLIDDASVGRTIFYDIYTDAQKQAEPSRKNAGLFFFRGKPGAPFAIIAPGGGFEYVASLHEGFPYAVEISKRGYNAFVLKYRARRGGAVATADLAAAISYVFRNARLPWRRDGRLFSVGQLGGRQDGRGDRLTWDRTVWRLGPAQAVDRRHLVHRPLGSRLQRNRRHSLRLVMPTESHLPPSWRHEWRRCGEPGTAVEYHKYPGVGHGFGLGVGTSAEGWIADAVRFWAKQIEREPDHADALALVGGRG